MITKKIAISLLSIVTALTLTGGATYAFFSDSATSGNNAFATGTLNINIDQSGGIFENSTPITGWQPGEERFVRFDITNDGSLPVILRAAATGTWDIGALDATKVQVVKVEFWNGSAWQQIAAAAEGLTGFVYYSPDGTNLHLFTLAGGARKEFRLTVKLDESADDAYQGRTFNASITAEARQTNDSF